MRISNVCGILGLMILFDLGYYFKSYQAQMKIEKNYQRLKTKQIHISRPHHSSDFFFTYWLKQAKSKHCQVQKIHPWYADPTHLHFNLRLQGQYDNLLAWIQVVHRGLPSLIWDKISFHRLSMDELELLVHCYEAD